MQAKREQRSDRAAGRSGKIEGFTDRGVHGLLCEAEQAYYLTGVLDSGAAGMEWSRFVWEAEGFAQMDMYALVSDRRSACLALDTAPLREVPAQIMQQGGVRRTGARALLFAPENTVPPMRGRYCRICGVFRRAAKSGGMLYGWRASYPKQSFAGYLPAVYQGYDLLERYFAVFEDLYLEREEQIGRFAERLDPARCGREDLDRLADWLLVPHGAVLPDQTLRRLVRSAAELNRRKGTARYYRTLLWLVTGELPELRPEPTRDRPGERRFQIIFKRPVDLPRAWLVGLLRRVQPLGVAFSLVVPEQKTPPAALDQDALGGTARMG